MINGYDTLMSTGSPLMATGSPLMATGVSDSFDYTTSGEMTY